MDNEIFFVDKDGNVKKGDILFTYPSNEFNKNFITYTDNQINENDELNVFCGSYTELSDKMDIDDVNDPAEIEFLNTMLKDYFDALED